MTLDMKITDEKEITAPEPRIQLEKPKKKKWGIYVILAVVLIILGGIVWGIFKGVAIFQKIGLNINANSLSLGNTEPALKKDSTGKYTNFLIIGIDTRPIEGGANTDTIMEVSYSYDTNNITMISIPRDFNVEIGKDSNWYDKINAVYAFTKDGDDTAGLKELQRTVEEVTGTEIQYYAMVNFDGFVKIVDTVGGVDINVEKSFTDSYYPAVKGDPEGHTTCGPVGIGCGFWKVVTFKAGIQHMDGETALEYARSRHSAQDGLDYGRAKRQQNVVMAVKDKVLSTSTLTNPKAIMGLISSVADNIKVSAFTITDIQAGLNLAKKFNEENGKTYSFILDPSVGNSELVSSNGASPVLGLGKYKDINEFVDLVMVKPALYSENATIYIYNIGLGNTEVTTKVKTLKEQYPYMKIIYKGTLFSDKEGNYIYSHTENEFATIVNEFATNLGIEDKTKPEFITTNLNGEDVTILLGKTVQLAE